MLSCKTPEVVVPKNVLEDFIGYDSVREVRLHVHLGDFFDVWNRSTMFRLVPFYILQNPTVNEWDSVRGFDVYDGETHIQILVRSANWMHHNHILIIILIIVIIIIIISLFLLFLLLFLLLILLPFPFPLPLQNLDF